MTPGPEATRIQLCGEFVIELGRPARRCELARGQLRLLLAYLVLNRDRPLSRDELVAAVWPGALPQGYAGALSALLSRLRGELSPHAQLLGRSEVRLVLGDGAWIDVEAAEAAVAEAEAALGRDDTRAAWAPANLTLNIIGRGLLAGHDAEWLDSRRRELDELALRALDCLARVGLALGGSELAAAERAARRTIEREPYRESGYRRLMEVHAARGDAAEALVVYERLRTVLREELGTAPGRELQELHRRLLEAPVRGRNVTAAASSAQAPAKAARPWPVARVELPAPLRFDRGLIGRERLLQEMGHAWKRAGGACRMVVLEGEAGIGKTRLGGELAQRAHGAGATVLYGRCDEEMVVAYQPIVEALSRLVATCPTELLREALAGGGVELARVLPELRRRLPELPPPGRARSDVQRYRLFEEVCELLEVVAAPAALLLVVDDLHWADRATLLLLRHVLRRAPAGMMMLGTFRTTEVEPSHPLKAFLADLHRERMARRIPVDGLDRREVGELIEMWTGEPAPAQLVDALREETDGNPFFIVELLRHLLESGVYRRGSGGWRGDVPLAEVGIPPGVGETIERRLGRLTEEAVATLRTAAVLGREFSLAALRTATGLDEERLLDLLDAARRAQLLGEVPGSVGRYAFSHALVRDTLYEAVGPTRRAWLHRKVADALEALHAGDLEPHLAELARHYSLASGEDVPPKTIEYSARAGRRARAQLAHEEAVRHFERALAALPGEGSESERCGLLLELGSALRAAADPERSRGAFMGAAGLAEQIGDAELLARAALGFAGTWLELGTLDRDHVTLLERALAALGPADSVTRANVLSRLAVEVYYEGSGRREALSAEAVAMARRLGDGVALARALTSRRVAISGSADLDERLAVTDELLVLASAGGATEVLLWGHTWRAVDLLERGRLDAAWAELDAYRRLAVDLRQPAYLWHVSLFAGMRALLEGRVAEVEGLIEEGVEVGTRAGDPNAANYLAVLRFMLARERGRLEEVEQDVADRIERFADMPVWRTLLALLHAELGRDPRARAELARLDPLNSLPVDINWLPSMSCVALTCALIGDETLAMGLYDLLAPHASRYVTTGHPIVFLGSVVHYLGVLAATLARQAEAVGHLERAVALHEAIGARPLAARSRYELGRSLLRTGTQTQRRRGRELLRRSRAEAVQLGLVALAGQATAALAAARG